MGETREITGKFAISYISFGIIIGILVLVGEIVLQQSLEMDYNIGLLIIHAVAFFLVTYLVTKVTVSSMFEKKKKISKENAKTVVKSVRVILMAIAIFIMFFNFFYYGNLFKSAKKDIDDGVIKEYSSLTEKEKDDKKGEILKVTSIYLVVAEIETIIAYVFVAEYIKAKTFTNVDKKTEQIQE